jgi:predicted O-methyltransferase YrrM
MLKVHEKVEKLWHRRGHLNEDQRDFLFNYVSNLRPKRCLEIGFAGGRSCITTYFACFPERMVSIDINLDYKRGREHSKLILAECPNLSLLELDSRTIDFRGLRRDYFGDVAIDFGFIDADHSYEGCLSDLENVYSISTVGSILMVDDYKSGKPNGHHFADVNRAVDDFVDKYKGKIVKSEWSKDGKGIAILEVI